MWLTSKCSLANSNALRKKKASLQKPYSGARNNKKTHLEMREGIASPSSPANPCDSTCGPRLSKFRTRRHRANARERERMHGLNAALNTLRRRVPVARAAEAGGAHRLSKIETLRLAKNYIDALSETLSTGTPLDALTFARYLARGLSQVRSLWDELTYGGQG